MRFPSMRWMRRSTWDRMTLILIFQQGASPGWSGTGSHITAVVRTVTWFTTAPPTRPTSTVAGITALRGREDMSLMMTCSPMTLIPRAGRRCCTHLARVRGTVPPMLETRRTGSCTFMVGSRMVQILTTSTYSTLPRRPGPNPIQAC